MTEGLLLPSRRLPAPEPPERIALDMAFGVGAGAVLGDKSRYRSHGAITTATWVAGVHGLCLDFVRATPDFVLIPAAHTQLDFTTEDFSIVTRVRVDVLAVWHSLFTRGQAANLDGYRLMLDTNGALRLYTCQAGVFQHSRSFNDVAALGWYTLGISRAGAGILTFVNGVDRTTIAGVHIDPLPCALDAYIGVENVGLGNALDGRMEFLRIFRGYALAASEHLAWHNALL